MLGSCSDEKVRVPLNFLSIRTIDSAFFLFFFYPLVFPFSIASDRWRKLFGLNIDLDDDKIIVYSVKK